MHPETPLYERLYLDGVNKPPVLTSSCVLAGMEITRDPRIFLNASRADRSSGMIRHLYKYRYLDVNDQGSIDKARSLLVKEEVWLAPMSELNDVFETEFEIEISAGKKEMSQVVDRQKHQLKNLPISPAKRLLLQHKMRRMKPQLTAEAEASVRRDMDGILGIFCASADPRSHALWTYYANGSKGFCVQFATYNDPVLSMASEMTYIDKTMATQVFERHEERKQVYLYKTTAYEQEREWRVALPDVKGPLRLAKNAVTGVIFGSRASKQTIETILSMNEARKARGLDPLKAYKAVPHRGVPHFKILSL